MAGVAVLKPHQSLPTQDESPYTVHPSAYRQESACKDPAADGGFHVRIFQDIPQRIENSVEAELNYVIDKSSLQKVLCNIPYRKARFRALARRGVQPRLIDSAGGKSKERRSVLICEPHIPEKTQGVKVDPGTDKIPCSIPSSDDLPALSVGTTGTDSGPTLPLTSGQTHPLTSRLHQAVEDSTSCTTVSQSEEADSRGLEPDDSHSRGFETDSRQVLISAEQSLAEVNNECEISSVAAFENAEVIEVEIEVMIEECENMTTTYEAGPSSSATVCESDVVAEAGDVEISGDGTVIEHLIDLTESDNEDGQPHSNVAARHIHNTEPVIHKYFPNLKAESFKPSSDTMEMQSLEPSKSLSVTVPPTPVKETESQKPITVESVSLSQAVEVGFGKCVSPVEGAMSVEDGAEPGILVEAKSSDSSEVGAWIELDQGDTGGEMESKETENLCVGSGNRENITDDILEERNEDHANDQMSGDSRRHQAANDVPVMKLQALKPAGSDLDLAADDSGVDHGIHTPQNLCDSSETGHKGNLKKSPADDEALQFTASKSGSQPSVDLNEPAPNYSGVDDTRDSGQNILAGPPVEVVEGSKDTRTKRHTRWDSPLSDSTGTNSAGSIVTNSQRKQLSHNQPMTKKLSSTAFMKSENQQDLNNNKGERSELVVDEVGDKAEVESAQTEAGIGKKDIPVKKTNEEYISKDKSATKYSRTNKAKSLDTTKQDRLKKKNLKKLVTITQSLSTCSDVLGGILAGLANPDTSKTDDISQKNKPCAATVPGTNVDGTITEGTAMDLDGSVESETLIIEQGVEAHGSVPAMYPPSGTWDVQNMGPYISGLPPLNIPPPSLPPPGAPPPSIPPPNLAPAGVVPQSVAPFCAALPSYGLTSTSSTCSTTAGSPPQATPPPPPPPPQPDIPGLQDVALPPLDPEPVAVPYDVVPGKPHVESTSSKPEASSISNTELPAETSPSDTAASVGTHMEDRSDNLDVIALLLEKQSTIQSEGPAQFYIQKALQLLKAEKEKGKSPPQKSDDIEVKSCTSNKVDTEPEKKSSGLEVKQDSLGSRKQSIEKMTKDEHKPTSGDNKVKPQDPRVKAKPSTAGQFHGRTLLKGKSVPARNIPLTPLYLKKSVTSKGTPVVIPVDPRKEASRLASVPKLTGGYIYGKPCVNTDKSYHLFPLSFTKTKAILPVTRPVIDNADVDKMLDQMLQKARQAAPKKNDGQKHVMRKKIEKRALVSSHQTTKIYNPLKRPLSEAEALLANAMHCEADPIGRRARDDLSSIGMSIGMSSKTYADDLDSDLDAGVDFMLLAPSLGAAHDMDMLPELTDNPSPIPGLGSIEPSPSLSTIPFPDKPSPIPASGDGHLSSLGFSGSCLKPGRISGVLKQKPRCSTPMPNGLEEGELPDSPGLPHPIPVIIGGSAEKLPVSEKATVKSSTNQEITKKVLNMDEETRMGFENEEKEKKWEAQGDYRDDCSQISSEESLIQISDEEVDDNLNLARSTSVEQRLVQEKYWKNPIRETRNHNQFRHRRSPRSHYSSHEKLDVWSSNQIVVLSRSPSPAGSLASSKSYSKHAHSADKSDYRRKRSRSRSPASNIRSRSPRKLHKYSKGSSLQHPEELRGSNGSKHRDYDYRRVEYRHTGPDISSGSSRGSSNSSVFSYGSNGTRDEWSNVRQPQETEKSRKTFTGTLKDIVKRKRASDLYDPAEPLAEDYRPVSPLPRLYLHQEYKATHHQEGSSYLPHQDPPSRWAAKQKDRQGRSNSPKDQSSSGMWRDRSASVYARLGLPLEQSKAAVPQRSRDTDLRRELNMKRDMDTDRRSSRNSRDTDRRERLDSRSLYERLGKRN